MFDSMTRFLAARLPRLAKVVRTTSSSLVSGVVFAMSLMYIATAGVSLIGCIRSALYYIFLTEI